MSRVVAWVDGAASVVMAKLELQEDPSVLPVHCDLGSSVHEDSHRFIDDAERWYGKAIERIKSPTFSNIDEVFEKRKYLSGVNGAPCTGELKFAPRLDWQLPSDTHLWGYTADKKDTTRFKRMQDAYPNMLQRAPLIEHGVTRRDCFNILEEAGIKRPVIYDLGYPNGNCLGCVKATSPNYWALTRLMFPEVFARRAEQSRRFGARLTRIKGERVFIDEIPADWPTTAVKVDACDFACTVQEMLK